eukprot:7044674-Ditylum_brightwellii.AAC.1
MEAIFSAVRWVRACGACGGTGGGDRTWTRVEEVAWAVICCICCDGWDYANVGCDGWKAKAWNKLTYFNSVGQVE